jgi:hypothetical protein
MVSFGIHGTYIHVASVAESKIQTCTKHVPIPDVDKAGHGRPEYKWVH